MQVYLSAKSHFPLPSKHQTVKCSGVDYAGKKIRRMRDERGWTQTQLAITASVSVPLIQKIEAGKPSTRRSLSKIAKALGVPTEQIAGELPPDDAVDENVSTLSEEEIDIPRFDLSVAAGRWIDVAESDHDAGYRPTPAQLKRKLFEVRVRGDSMDGGKNPIADGTIVRFRLLFDDIGLPDCTLIEFGKSYYVQLTDGRATFKRAVDCGNGKLTLAANNKKYREKLECDLELICRLAVATAEVREF